MSLFSITFWENILCILAGPVHKYTGQKLVCLQIVLLRFDVIGSDDVSCIFTVTAASKTEQRISKQRICLYCDAVLTAEGLSVLQIMSDLSVSYYVFIWSGDETEYCFFCFKFMVVFFHVGLQHLVVIKLLSKTYSTL